MSIYITGLIISFFIMWYETSKSKYKFDNDSTRLMTMITFSMFSWLGIIIWLLSDTKEKNESTSKTNEKTKEHQG